MHPIERLRHVARSRGFDADTLAYESAEALGDLAFDEQAIVLAARRLLDQHPGCGPLWWVAAHILCADSPRAAARQAALELAGDPTSDELAAALPGAAHIVISPTPDIVRACVQRPDIELDVVDLPGDDFRMMRSLRYLPNTNTVFLEELGDEDSATIVVVSVLAVSTLGYLMHATDAALITAAKAAGLSVWVMAGVGHVLPTPLFDACLNQLGMRATPEPDDVLSEFISRKSTPKSDEFRWVSPVEIADVMVGPEGAFAPRAAAMRSTCPIPGELRSW